MGQHVQLVLVGANAGRNMDIKGIGFKAGRASLLAPDSKIGGILRYLETQGAYPESVAVEKQKQIDAYKLAQKGVDVKAKKAADLRAQLAALEAEEAPTPVTEPEPTPEPAPLEEPVSEPEPEVEAADGAVQDHEDSEGPKAERTTPGHQTSRKKRKHR